MGRRCKRSQKERHELVLNTRFSQEKEVSRTQRTDNRDRNAKTTIEAKQSKQTGRKSIGRPHEEFIAAVLFHS